MSATSVTGSTSRNRGPETVVSGPRAARRLLSSVQRIDLLGLIGVVAIFVAWWAVTSAKMVRPLYLPPLSDVWEFAHENFFSSKLIANQNLGTDGIWGSVLYSAEDVWFGVLIAVAVGLPLGLLSARAIKVRMFSDPLLLTISGVPIIIVAPFFVIWFGPARTTQLLLLVLFCAPVIYIYAQRAVDNLSSVYESNARVFGASRSRMIRDVYLRGTLPEVLGGMRIALAGSWGLGAFSELLGAPKGVGKLIVGFASSTNVTAIWAIILCFAVIAVLTDFVLVLLTGFLNRWMA